MTDFQRLQIATEALRRVANPMLEFYSIKEKQEKELGVKLTTDGIMLTHFLRDPQTYKRIAEEALKEIGHAEAKVHT